LQLLYKNSNIKQSISCWVSYICCLDVSLYSFLYTNCCDQVAGTLSWYLFSVWRPWLRLSVILQKCWRSNLT